MPQQKYYTVLTAVGEAAFANALLLGTKVSPTYFAVGDGGGAYYQPDRDMRALRGEKWRGRVTACEVSVESPNVLEVGGLVPGDVGGFTVRELGVLDENGTLLAIGNTPDMEKVALSDGVVAEMPLSMVIAVNGASDVVIEIDPTVTIATKEDVAKGIAAHDGSDAAHGNLRAELEGKAEKIFYSETEPTTALADYGWVKILRTRRRDAEAVLLRTSAADGDGHYANVDGVTERIENATDDLAQAGPDDVVIIEI